MRNCLKNTNLSFKTETYISFTLRRRVKNIRCCLGLNGHFVTEKSAVLRFENSHPRRYHCEHHPFKIRMNIIQDWDACVVLTRNRPLSDFVTLIADILS